MNQSFGFKKGSFVIRGPLVSVVIPAIAFIYQIYSLLLSLFGSLSENFQGSLELLFIMEGYQIQLKVFAPHVCCNLLYQS